MTYELPVRRGGEIVAYAKVDRLDYLRLARYRWTFNPKGYVIASARGNVRLALHREVLGLRRGDGLEADHINGDPLDNRSDNLRIATRAQNGQNVPPQRGIRGVTYDSSRKSPRRWRARPAINGRAVHVGWFDTEEEAGAAAAKWYAENMPFSNPDRHRAVA